MKKIVFLLLFCGSVFNICATQVIDSTTWKRNVLLSFAKKVNYFSLNGDGRNKKIIDSIKNADNFEVLIEVLKGKDNNIVLTSVIEKYRIYAITETLLNDSSINDFVKVRLNKPSFDNYRKKRSSNKMEEITSGIVESINEELKHPPYIDDGMNLSSEESDLNVPESKGLFASDSAIVANIWNIILSLALAGVGCFCYLLYRNNQKDKEQLNQNEGKITDLANSIVCLKNYRDSLKSDVFELRKELVQLSSSLEILKNSTKDDVAEAVSENKKQPIIKEEILFAEVPSPDGIFTKVSEVYKKGKSLYKIITNGDGYGELEVVNTPESVAVFIQSKDILLEPACEIENDLSVFTHIVLEKNGTVCKDENGAWKVVSKVIVSLS